MSEAERAMPLTQATFAALVLEESERRWEIVCGKLREKPAMSVPHNRFARRLVWQLHQQLSLRDYEVFHNDGHVQVPGGDSYVPDVAVVPIALIDALQRQGGTLETYAEPVPFVVEVRSPSTGLYDVNYKIPGYQERGDREIWRVHPLERTVTIWRRQPDGTYVESDVRGGTVRVHAIPDVTIDLDQLFGD